MVDEQIFGAAKVAAWVVRIVLLLYTLGFARKHCNEAHAR